MGLLFPFVRNRYRKASCLGSGKVQSLIYWSKEQEKNLGKNRINLVWDNISGAEGTSIYVVSRWLPREITYSTSRRRKED